MQYLLLKDRKENLLNTSALILKYLLLSPKLGSINKNPILASKTG
jgi:hypothetical protein